MSEAENDELEPRFAVQIRYGVRVPLRGGGSLSANLYLPKDCGSRPCLVTLTPYVAQSCHDQARYFAERGYPFLCVDVRGRGDSDGEFHPRNDGKDGYDVVEWVAQQPYCDGQVAMWGLSYMGYTQWVTAAQLPPHLRSLAPVASPFRGVDSPMRNCVFPTFTMKWLIGLAGRAAHDKILSDRAFWGRQFLEWFQCGQPLNMLDSFLGAPSSLFQEWIAHPHQGAYWDSYNPTPQQYGQIRIPVLTITGAYDGDQPGALAHYREHIRESSAAGRGSHYLIIGPWDHVGTLSPKTEFGGLKLGQESRLDLMRLHMEWYRWTLSGGARPAFLRNYVAYYVMVADEWRYAESLDAVTAGFQTVYLQSSSNPSDPLRSGSLAPESSGTSQPDHYVYDPGDVTLAQLECDVDPESRTDQRMVYASVGRQLVYHTAPFERDREISGFFRLSLWLSIDQPDTSFWAAVYEIDMNGNAVQLTTDWMRARHRESFRHEKLITSDQPLRYDFERFTFISRLIRKGHRLRLVFGPQHSIYWQRNYNSGGVVPEESLEQARVVNVRLYHDAAHPSALYVPLGRQSSCGEHQ